MNESQIEGRIRSLGYDSVLAFFQQNPGVPYGVLLKKVARPVEGTNHLDIPMFAFRELYRREAVRAGLERPFAKDGLIRSLREHLGRGWGRGKNARQRRARACAYWTRPTRNVELLCDRVWDALEQLDPPDDWRPQAAGDEYVDKAFDIAWPESV